MHKLLPEQNRIFFKIKIASVILGNLNLKIIKCFSSNLIEGKSKEDCKFKECTDKQWTYGEDCNDGNKIERNGCSKCKIDPNYQFINKILEPLIGFKCSDNCNQCDFNYTINSTICTQSEQGYFIKQSVCVRFAQQCLQFINSAFKCTSC